MAVIKKTWCNFCCFMISAAAARAASILVREGRHEEARNLMLNKDLHKCC